MIDILLATYNGEDFLEQQLDSILSQSVDFWKIIAHDDGSSDRTISILLDYQNKYPDKIFIINDGVTFGSAKLNFEHLLKLSCAEYVMFCDQDDIWLPYKVEKTYLLMQEAERQYPQSPCVVHSDLQVVNVALELIHSSMFRYQCLPRDFHDPQQILVQNNVTGCTMMVNRAAIVVSLPISETAIMHDWWITAQVLLSQGKVMFLDESTILYRQHSRNTVGSIQIGIYHYVKRLFRFARVISSYSRIVRQARALGFNCAYCLLFMKLKILANRVFFCAK